VVAAVTIAAAVVVVAVVVAEVAATVVAIVTVAVVFAAVVRKQYMRQIIKSQKYTILFYSTAAVIATSSVVRGNMLRIRVVSSCE